jgi:hypothetical protein
MGLDFIQLRAKPYRKRWDNGRKALATADLFTRETSCAARSVPFDLDKDAALCVGDTVVVEAQGTSLIARQRLAQVGRIDNPPAELWRAVKESCGIAKGTIEHLHGLARVAEISLC